MQAQLNLDMDRYDMTEDERFAWTIQLIQDPSRPFSRLNLFVLSEEALTVARKAIYNECQDLCANPTTSGLMGEALPTIDATLAVFSQIAQNMEIVLRGGGFRIKEALTCLERLSGTGAYAGGGFDPTSHFLMMTCRPYANWWCSCIVYAKQHL